MVSKVLFRAIIPPKAEVGSVLNAKSYAPKIFSDSATPQGLACLTMTHAGSSNALTHSPAASMSEGTVSKF